MNTVIDFSAGVPPAVEVKAAGHIGVMRYISPPRLSWMTAKPATRPQIDRCRSAGVDVGFVWQYGGADNPDTMRGRTGGHADATSAQAKLNELGCPRHPVFFAVDFDISLDQWNATAVHYFKAACEVLGCDRMGIYGHSRVISWAVEDQVIADLGGGKHLAWQTPAWSMGERATEAVLYQGTANVKGPAGINIDVNEVLHHEWGQHPVGETHLEKSQEMELAMKPNPNHRGDPLFLPDVLKAFGVKVQEWDGWRDRGHGDFTIIQGVFAHHTGTDKDIPGYIADHPELGLCSQIHLNRDGTAVIVGAGIAWHAGRGSYQGWPTDNANQVAIGIEAASSGTSPWPPAQLDAYYRTCAAILWYLGKPATPQTLLGHKEYSGAAQGKWDPGGIDMNDFRRNVQHYIDNPPFLAADAAHITKEEDPMIQSLINPAKKFAQSTLISIVDATCWQILVLAKAIAKKQGLDPDQILADAITADREGK